MAKTRGENGRVGGLLLYVPSARLGVEIISKYVTLKLCYIPTYINTDGRLPCTLRVYPQFNVSASYHFYGSSWTPFNTNLIRA